MHHYVVLVKMLSAICFNLEQSKVLSSDNGIILMTFSSKALFSYVEGSNRRPILTLLFPLQFSSHLTFLWVCNNPGNLSFISMFSFHMSGDIANYFFTHTKKNHTHTHTQMFFMKLL